MGGFSGGAGAIALAHGGGPYHARCAGTAPEDLAHPSFSRRGGCDRRTDEDRCGGQHGRHHRHDNRHRLREPLNLSAPDGNSDCIYTYNTGSSSTPEFTLKYSGKGITVTGTYEGPPGSMQITYGNSSSLDFDSAILALFPTADPVGTVKENSPSSGR